MYLGMYVYINLYVFKNVCLCVLVSENLFVFEN